MIILQIQITRREHTQVLIQCMYSMWQSRIFKNKLTIPPRYAYGRLLNKYYLILLWDVTYIPGFDVSGRGTWLMDNNAYQKKLIWWYVSINIILFLNSTLKWRGGGGSRKHRANPGQDACTLSPPSVVTIFARGTHKICRMASIWSDAGLPPIGVTSSPGRSGTQFRELGRAGSLLTKALGRGDSGLPKPMPRPPRVRERCSSVRVFGLKSDAAFKIFPPRKQQNVGNNRTS
jgi:hypothetical protein